MLGLGNDKESRISDEAKILDSKIVVSFAEFKLAENASKQAERALEEAEIALLEHANKALEFLHGKSPTADSLKSMMDPAQESPPEEDLVRFTVLRRRT